MYRRSPITIRLFLMLLILISSIFGSIYWFTVPLIKENVFGLELHTNRQVLNIVYDLANRMYSSTETYVDKTLNSHEQRLDSLLKLTEDYIEVTQREGRKQGKSDDEIWAQIFSDLRQFEFGNNDYLWVADYNAKLLSHPSDQFYQKDMSAFTDPEGTLIIPKILKLARQEGHGFYKYKWNRLGSTEIIDKYSYVRDFPEWGFVIGAGVYIEDIHKEVEAQKQQAIFEINKALRNIKIASNGYLFVFDSAGNMLFHPNPNIHGINFKQQLNPVTQNPIYLDLMAVADTGEELYYKWDRPDDQGNYEYEKLSLVRHLSGFDWYISSSVYLDDLKASSIQLSHRIMAMGFFGLLAAIVAAFLFAEWLTSPIKKLSLTAYKISRGNLSAKTGINRDDELGLLAESFDYMVDRLRDNIDTLNSRVKSRTKALSESNTQLLKAVESLENTQLELRAHESRQRMILDALPAQIAYVDNQLRFVFANQQYREVFNQSKEEIEGKPLVEVVGEEMFEMLGPYIERTLQGELPVYEYRLQHKGEEIITRRTMMPFLSEQGEIDGFLTLSIDITHEREAEKRMAEASKMKAVGQMSGGLAHDFNNLLTIILGNLLQLKNLPNLGDEKQSNLVPAIRATRRGADMTKRLLAFSRRQSLSPARIKPEFLLDELVDLLSAPLPESIQLRTQVAPHTPDVYVDAAQMEDALVNLALNSADAMPKGGEISIAVRAVNSADTEIDRGGFDDEILAGQYVMIRVCDGGEGFSEEALNKACEPFFTTKSTGAGSGLGLSMVYGFVKQSKGYLRIENKDENRGACIDLLLPVATDEQVLEPEKEEKTSLVIGDKQESDLILLVEDNDDLRTLVRQQLTSAEYKVIEASSGDEALNLLTGIESLAGVVSDVVMPGETDGYAVADAVKICHPKAFVVLMTGYTEHAPITDFDMTLLHKPFDPEELLDALPEKAENLAVAGGHHE